MIQFGFVTLFSIALPLIPLVAFINNIFEILIDRHKVVNLTRRPVPAVAKGHGIFTLIFGIISFLAIFTNLGIMSFTGKTFGEENQYTAFLWFTIAALFFKFFLQETIPDFSESTFNVMQRHKVVVKKALAKLYRNDEGSHFKIERINLDVLFTKKHAATKTPVDDSQDSTSKKSSKQSGKDVIISSTGKDSKTTKSTKKDKKAKKGKKVEEEEKKVEEGESQEEVSGEESGEEDKKEEAEKKGTKGKKADKKRDVKKKEEKKEDKKKKVIDEKKKPENKASGAKKEEVEEKEEAVSDEDAFQDGA